MAEDIRETLAPCWTIDPDAPPIQVGIAVTMRPDGTVAEAAPSDRDRYRSDPSYRSAADRAIRAALDPLCQPLPFSSEDWPSWQSVVLVFDPGPFFDGQ